MGLLSPQPPREETGVNGNAARLLTQRGIVVRKIVQVNTDSILYLGSHDRPMTAWLAYNAGRLDVVAETGFPAEPAGWVLRRLHPEPKTAPAAAAAAGVDPGDYDQA